MSNPQMTDDENKNQVPDFTELDENIQISMNICLGVVQRYIAHILGKDTNQLFPDGVYSSHCIGFEFAGSSASSGSSVENEKVFLKLDLVDWKTYKFDLGKFNCKQIRQSMASTINNLKPVFDYAITLISPDITIGSDIFTQPFKVVSDPHTNIFIFNPSENKQKNLTNLKYMHDIFPFRIGFTWFSQNVTN